VERMTIRGVTVFVLLSLSASAVFGEEPEQQVHQGREHQQSSHGDAKPHFKEAPERKMVIRNLAYEDPNAKLQELGFNVVESRYDKLWIVTGGSAEAVQQLREGGARIVNQPYGGLDRRGQREAPPGYEQQRAQQEANHPNGRLQGEQGNAGPQRQQPPPHVKQNGGHRGNPNSANSQASKQNPHQRSNPQAENRHRRAANENANRRQDESKTMSAEERKEASRKQHEVRQGTKSGNTKRTLSSPKFSDLAKQKQKHATEAEKIKRQSFDSMKSNLRNAASASQKAGSEAAQAKKAPPNLQAQTDKQGAQPNENARKIKAEKANSHREAQVKAAQMKSEAASKAGSDAESKVQRKVEHQVEE